ncbi:hypothetical protein LIER_40410 [Lithospermum erythrorhizon]|uniref:SWIM-type domain-containing protein n=1 Tax=Lithospermum erythrorhizon TaxID=34254 RepID=A0AAV3QZS9_LITER
MGSVGFTFIWNGKNGFEVKDCSGNQFSVDTGKRICSCGSWQLCGIPCPHAITCLHENKKPLEEAVSDCYSKATFMRTYDHVLNPAGQKKVETKTSVK